MRILPLVLALALPCALPAQEVLFESFTGKNWSHKGGTPNWKDGVSDSRADFGKVDQLNSIKDLVYNRVPLVLEAGTYVAVARVAKITDSKGAAPLDLEVTTATGKKKITLTVAEQKVDKFVHTVALVFALNNKGPALFKLQNTDQSITKRNYLFDSFHVGQVDVGGAIVAYQSMGRRWGHAWGCPHYKKEIRDKGSAFGFVERLNQRWSSTCGNGSANLWWFDWGSRAFKLPAGTYTANIRLKKIVSIRGNADFKYFVRRSTDGGKSWRKFKEIVWKGSTHTLDKYVNSPDMVFTVTNPNDQWSFKLRHICCFAKENYHIDAFSIRRGGYETIEPACKTSLGELRLGGSIPTQAMKAEMRAENVPNAAIFTFGVTPRRLDLSSIGMSGCFAFTTPLSATGVAAKNGVATLQYDVPNNPWLRFKNFYNQAFALDPKANAFGLASSNGRKATIGY